MPNEPLDQTYVFEGSIYLPGVTDYPDQLAENIAAKKLAAAKSPFKLLSPVVGLPEPVAAVEVNEDEDLDVVTSEVPDSTPEVPPVTPPVPVSDHEQTGLTRTPLPDDFPALRELNDAGISDIEGVLAIQATLTSVAGIGPARAAEISAWLEQNITLGD